MLFATCYNLVGSCTYTRRPKLDKHPWIQKRWKMCDFCDQGSSRNWARSAKRIHFTANTKLRSAEALISSQRWTLRHTNLPTSFKPRLQYTPWYFNVLLQFVIHDEDLCWFLSHELYAACSTLLSSLAKQWPAIVLWLSVIRSNKWVYLSDTVAWAKIKTLKVYLGISPWPVVKGSRSKFSPHG